MFTHICTVESIVQRNQAEEKKQLQKLKTGNTDRNTSRNISLPPGRLIERKKSVVVPMNLMWHNNLEDDAKKIIDLIVKCPSIARVRNAKIPEIGMQNLDLIGQSMFKKGFRSVMEMIKSISPANIGMFMSAGLHEDEINHTKTSLRIMRIVLYVAAMHAIDQYILISRDERVLLKLQEIQRAIQEHASVKGDGDSVWEVNQSPHGWEDFKTLNDDTSKSVRNLLEEDDSWGESDSHHPMPIFVSPLTHAVRLGNVECVEKMISAGANSYSAGVYLKRSLKAWRCCKFARRSIASGTVAPNNEEDDVATTEGMNEEEKRNIVSTTYSITPYHVALCGSKMVTTGATDNAVEAYWEKKTWRRMIKVMQRGKGVEEGRRWIACKYALDNICISLTFLLMLLVLNFMLWDEGVVLYFNKTPAFTELHESASGIKDDASFYAWAKGPFINTLFETAEYNPIPKMAGKLNYIIGSVRFTQFRLKQEPCQGAKGIFKNLVKNNICFKRRHSRILNYNPWSSSAFGPNLEYQATKLSNKPFTVYGAKEGGKGSYPSNGFKIDFDARNKTKTLLVMNKMEKDKWFSPADGTAAIIVSFTIYNALNHRVAHAQLVIEMWETGASNVVSKIFVLKWESESMMKATNTFLLITFIVFLVFTVNEVNALWDGHSRRVLSEIMDDPEAWEKLKLSEKPWYHSIFAKVIVTFCYCFTVKGLGDGKDLKDKTKQSVQKVTTATWQYIRGALSNPYLSDPWNYVELIIGSFFFRLYWFHTRVVILRSQAQIDVKNALDDPKSYIDLNDITESIFQRQDQLALTLIFVFLHGLKAIHRIPYLGIGFRTIAITRTIFSSDILPFYVVLLFLVSGFAFSFMFAFGDEVYGYHTFVDAIYNTLLTANGQDVRNMELIEGSHWSYAYVLIFFLIFFLALLLMNIFIAVVSEVYAKATETAFEDFHKMVDEEMMHEINHIKVHITTQITKKNITKHLNVKSTSTDMSLSTAIKKTIRNASISSVNRTKEKERSVGESSEETLRRVVPELLKRNAVVMKLKKLNDVQKS